MKKLVIAMFVLCMGIGMMSCSKDKKVDLQELVAKAKAEGAKWDEAQWKEAIKDLFTGAKPMIDWMKDVETKMKEAEGGEDAAKLAAAAKLMEEAEAKQKEFEPLTKAMEEFMEIAENNPTAKKVMDDKAFQEEMKKEFNLPEEMF
ncbi:MAG: hypothetical protein IJJ68_06930 [Prevotella sp.]|nr:hypothetical protein [Prevotella sp.]